MTRSVIVANPLVGAARDRMHGFSSIAVVLAVWIVPGAFVWLALDPHVRRSANESAVFNEESIRCT
jgi:hypothetical protein